MEEVKGYKHDPAMKDDKDYKEYEALVSKEDNSDEDYKKIGQLADKLIDKYGSIPGGETIRRGEVKYKEDNIEYKRGWQIERNKNNPKALHQLFSNDKIIHGIGPDLNIGMAESLEEIYDFVRIFNESHPKEEQLRFEEAQMSRGEIREAFKQFLFHGDTSCVPQELVDAITTILVTGLI